MNVKLDENIQENDKIEDHINKECFFFKAQENCILLIKEKFSSFFFLSKKISTLELVTFTKAIYGYCKPHNNRKKIYMFVLSKQIYNSCKNQKRDKEGCISYVFDKLLNESKKFDIEQSSIIFQTVKTKFKELEELYRHKDNANLSSISSTILLNSKEIEEIRSNSNYSQKESIGAINNYIKKIVKYYQTEKFDKKSREALIDNALLHIEDSEIRNYFKHKVFDYRKEQKQKKILIESLLSIESELLLFLSKEEISYILSSVLYEFIYKEQFFSFINKRIPFRITDFYRKNSSSSKLKIIKKQLMQLNWSTTQPIIMLTHYQYHYLKFIEPIIKYELTVSCKKKSEEDSYELEVEDDVETLLNAIKKIASPAEQTILFLKFGLKLSEEVDSHITSFTNNDIYEIRLFIHCKTKLSLEINKKIENLKSALFNELKDKRGKNIRGIREDRMVLEAKIVEKLYKSEPLTYKEISLMFGQQPKWASKKKELFLKKLEGIKDDRF
jgi:hypothetical protein